MSRPNILIYIAIVAAIIAFGQYQKTKFIKKVSPAIPAVSVEAAPVITKLNKPPKIQESPKTSPVQELEPKPNETTASIIIKNEEIKVAPTNLPESTNTISKVSHKSIETNVENIVSNNVDSTSTQITTPRPPDLALYLPEKTNLTKEEKIEEIKKLASIFNDQLVYHYKDIKISYIQGDFKVGVLLGDSIEYYEDPAAFQERSTSSFVKSTMEFIEIVQRLRREAHQRYLNNNKQ